jgi:predicted enzyme related to lactoylglutathione lyase
VVLAFIAYLKQENKINMKRVTGLGGAFFKAKDPKALAAWYEKHLGINFGGNTYGVLFWDEDPKPDKRGTTVFSVFPDNTEYFAPSKNAFMFNLRVENLDWLLDTLKTEGVQVMDDTQTMEGIGKFGWIVDPEGNKVELWEPAKA